MSAAFLGLSSIEGKVLYNEPMKKYTTFRIGGIADILVFPKNFSDILICLDFCKKNGLSFHVFGGGSKILVGDNGLRGLVLLIKNTMAEIRLNDTQVIVGAGCSLQKMVKIAATNSLSGLEFATGIPGTVGGAVYMNAGTYLGTISNIIVAVTAFDVQTGSIVILSKEQCDFSNRASIFQKRNLIIITVEFQLKRGSQKEIRQSMLELIAKRKNSQPTEKYSAGSIFKNPEGKFVAQMIDSLSLKKTRIGDAEISEKHANFIVNIGNAKSADVCNLIALIQEKIRLAYGLTLSLELQILE